MWTAPSATVPRVHITDIAFRKSMAFPVNARNPLRMTARDVFWRTVYWVMSFCENKCIKCNYVIPITDHARLSRHSLLMHMRTRSHHPHVSRFMVCQCEWCHLCVRCVDKWNKTYLSPPELNCTIAKASSSKDDKDDDNAIFLAILISVLLFLSLLFIVMIIVLCIVRSRRHKPDNRRVR